MHVGHWTSVVPVLLGGPMAAPSWLEVASGLGLFKMTISRTFSWAKRCVPDELHEGTQCALRSDGTFVHEVEQAKLLTSPEYSCPNSGICSKAGVSCPRQRVAHSKTSRICIAFDVCFHGATASGSQRCPLRDRGSCRIHPVRRKGLISDSNGPAACQTGMADSAGVQLSPGNGSTRSPRP